MYLIDSMTNTLLRAAFHPDEGEVGEFASLCRIEPGLPDGLAVDVDGSIWVAVWGNAEVRRFNPGGELTATIPMPVTQPASCAFGPDGSLYITTARNGLSPEDLANQPHAGSVFALRPAPSAFPSARSLPDQRLRSPAVSRWSRTRRIRRQPVASCPPRGPDGRRRIVRHARSPTRFGFDRLQRHAVCSSAPQRTERTSP